MSNAQGDNQFPSEEDGATPKEDRESSTALGIARAGLRQGAPEIIRKQEQVLLLQGLAQGGLQAEEQEGGAVPKCWGRCPNQELRRGE